MMQIDESRLTPTSRLLTRNELGAFHEAFALFDHKRNGRISCEEFLETLRRVGVSVNEEVVYDLIVAQDENGNGELDFEEYVNFMTNEDIFMGLVGGLHAPNKPDYKDVLLYEVMSEFISKSCLKENQRKEIVGYYTRKFKKAAKKQNLMHAAHVVHHYADGARAFGLSDKEIFSQIESIRQQNDSDERKKNSPYARPIPLVLASSGSRQKPKWPKQPGWKPSQISQYGIKLPSITMQEPISFEHVQEIREKVHKIKEDYYSELSKVQRKHFTQVWKNLHVGGIPSRRLKEMIREIFAAYTARRLTSL